MSGKKIASLIAVILIAIGLIVSGYSAWQRVGIERSHKTAALLLDFAQVKRACAVENITLAEGLARFLPYASGVVIKEPTINDLRDNNILVIKSGAELMAESDSWPALTELNKAELKSGYNYLFFSATDDMLRVRKHILAKVPGAVAETVGAKANVLATSLPASSYGSMGVGFAGSDLDSVEAAGLQAVVQIRDNYYPYSVEAIDAEIGDLKGHEIMAIGFNDASVSGANLPLEKWAELKTHWLAGLKELGAPLVTAEFYDQKGLDSLALGMDQHVLRLHAIGEQEMLTTLTEEKAIERLQLAAAERNIKLLLVRFLPYGDISQNVAYFANIDRALWQKGIVAAAPAAAAPLLPNHILLFVIALAVLAGLWLLALSFRIPFRLATAGFFLGALLAAGLLLIGRAALMQKGFALLAVMTFPTLAVIHLTSDKPAGIPKAIARLLTAAAFSLIGAGLLVGLLADGDFMLKLSAFAGVKLAVVAPLLLIFIWFLFLKEKNTSATAEMIEVLDKPLTLKYLLLGAVVGLVLVIYVMRSGNDTVSVSSLERTFRAFLDNVMVVRPRTKEFLLGYPLLLCVFYYGYSKKMLPVLLLGSIGLVSSVNTFAHIHTPLLISLWRTANGLVLGIAGGVALIGLSLLLTRCFKKYFH